MEQTETQTIKTEDGLEPVSDATSVSMVEFQQDNGKIIDKIMSLGVRMNGNALIVRAFKTFVQAGLAAWAVTSFDFGNAAIVGAIAAGVSAVMNLFIKPTEA